MAGMNNAEKIPTIWNMVKNTGHVNIGKIVRPRNSNRLDKGGNVTYPVD